MAAGVRELVLVIMACTQDNSVCKEYRVPVYETALIQTCTAPSLGAVMMWMQQHPDLVLDHWRCEPRNEGDK